MIAVAVLCIVLFLIAFRQVGKLRLQIWQVMLLGAIAVLVTGQISPASALHAINFEVMLFLFGMFAVGQAMEDSGYLSHIAYKMFRHAKSQGMLLLMIIFGMGIASAFLMNDTIAIVGTPVVLLLAKKHGIHAKVLLLALAFAVTIGSVMSPIGNPQNFLIASEGDIRNPFLTFAFHLALPTMLNLLATFLLLRHLYKEHFHDKGLSHSQEPIRNHNLATVSKISLAILILLICAKMLLAGLGMDLNLTYIAIAAAAPVLIYRVFAKNFHIMRRIDWFTLVFFAAMFVLMQAVWESGFVQHTMEGYDVQAPLTIFTASILLSQLISNVPLVALYIPLLAKGSVQQMMALAAGSTIAGNMMILGAASNVIIIQNAEKKGETITFLEFARIGVPLTIINSIIYYLFL